jgi:hypothetical protein
MLQVYCFHESDVQEAYRKLNIFLAELAAVGVEVPLDHVQCNTKTYPDYGTTATTINVALVIETQSAYEVMPQVLEAHRRALNSQVEVPEVDDIAEAFRLINEAGNDFLLDHKEEGWVLTDLSDQGHVFYGVPRHEVLERVRMALPAKPSALTISDFDPFLDSDEELA